jgi:large subunit ribosomal protein L4
MKLKYYKKDGSFLEERDFNIPVFDGDRAQRAVKYVIEALQANMRQGNASTKTRSDVRGGGRKPYRQKGTGNARRGSNRSPLMPGGGIVFGPHPRDYSKKVNKKVKKLALARSIFDCANELLISVIEGFEFENCKSRVLNQFLKEIFPNGSVLMIDSQFSDEVILSSRNIERAFIIDSASVNTLDFKSYDHFLVTENGFNELLQRLK